MTDEDIQALTEARDAAEKKAAEATAAAEAARQEAEKAKQTVNNLVEEVKSERQKKQEALEKANITNPQPADVQTLVEKALYESEVKRRQAEMTEAINEFKNSKPEFQSDTSGIIFDKFRNELAKFNLEDIKTKSEAVARLNEIYRFVNFKQENRNDGGYEGSPSNGYSVPVQGEQTNKELDTAIRSAGMSEEKFKTLRSKYPDALNGLGIAG